MGYDAISLDRRQVAIVFVACCFDNQLCHFDGCLIASIEILLRRPCLDTGNEQSHTSLLQCSMHPGRHMHGKGCNFYLFA